MGSLDDLLLFHLGYLESAFSLAEMGLNPRIPGCPLDQKSTSACLGTSLGQRAPHAAVAWEGGPDLHAHNG